jgi:hypothetical protein
VSPRDPPATWVPYPRPGGHAPGHGRRRPRSRVLRLDAGSRLASAGHSVGACDTRAGARGGSAGEGRAFQGGQGSKWLFCPEMCRASRQPNPADISSRKCLFRGFSGHFSGVFGEFPRSPNPAKLARCLSAWDPALGAAMRQAGAMRGFPGERSGSGWVFGPPGCRRSSLAAELSDTPTFTPVQARPFRIFSVHRGLAADSDT